MKKQAADEAKKKTQRECAQDSVFTVRLRSRHSPALALIGARTNAGTFIMLSIPKWHFVYFA